MLTKADVGSLKDFLVFFLIKNQVFDFEVIVNNVYVVVERAHSIRGMRTETFGCQ